MGRFVFFTFMVLTVLSNLAHGGHPLSPEEGGFILLCLTGFIICSSIHEAKSDIEKKLEETIRGMAQGNAAQGVRQEGRQPTLAEVFAPKEELRGHWHSGYKLSYGKAVPPYESPRCDFNRRLAPNSFAYIDQPLVVARSCPYRDSRSTR